MALSSSLFSQRASLARGPAGCRAARRVAAPARAARVQRAPQCPAQQHAPAARGGALVARAASQDYMALFGEPDRAKEAIDLGLKYTGDGRWAEALPIFEKALTLPGTGLKRFKDKPPAISEGEKSAALYNVACCHAQLGDARNALVALSGCLEAGYADFDQIRGDADLAPLRADERFEGLLARFEPKAQGGLLGALFGRK